jgi:hypothetical protein
MTDGASRVLLLQSPGDDDAVFRRPEKEVAV